LATPFRIPHFTFRIPAIASRPAPLGRPRPRAQPKKSRSPEVFFEQFNELREHPRDDCRAAPGTFFLIFSLASVAVDGGF
jgi:hypothetical protein